MNKIYFQKNSSHAETYIAIGKILRELFDTEKDILFYFPQANFIAEGSLFEKALQYIEVDFTHILQSLSTTKPFSIQWNRKEILIQRIDYKNKLSNFSGLNYQGKTLFSPLISNDDAVLLKEKCIAGNLKFIVFSEIIDDNQKIFDLFEKKEEI